MHVLFVEPATYTLDLFQNIYSNVGVTFLHSDSKAVWSNKASVANAYYCDNHSWCQNVRHFINIGLNNQLVISNGYTHWSFRLLFVLSFFKKLHIGIESDTPYSAKKGLKKIIKSLYLTPIFSRKCILGFAGGNGAHMDLFLKYGMEKERVFLLPMMIDNEKYYKTEEEVKQSFVFLCVGRLIPEKSIDILIDAFSNIFTNIDVQLLIVGSGICAESLKSSSKLFANIIFKGPLFGEELIACYHQADVLVLPSVSEKWGLVVNEALCSGLAVVNSDSVGAAADLVIKPNSGWVFETGNQVALEKLLLHCVKHPEEVAEKAQNGVNFMKNHWSYTTYKQNLEEIKNYVANH